MAGSNSSDALLLSATDGSVQAHFPEMNGMIMAAAGDGAGGWYIAGGFTRIDGHQRQGLAHILADGRVNESWAPTVEGGWFTLLIHENMLYVAGRFSSINGVDRSNLARIRLSDGSLDENWAPTVEGSHYPAVQAVATDGEYMYIGGRFTSVNGREIRNAARISLEDGLLDEDWVPDPSSSVTSLLLHEDHLFVAGRFTVIGGEERSRLAKLHKANALVVDAWEADHEVMAAVRMEAHGGNLYVGGSRVWDQASEAYIPYSGLNRFSIASGTRDDTWAHGIDRDITALSLSEESLYVGASGGIGLKDEKAGVMPPRPKWIDAEEFVLIHKIDLGSERTDPDFSPPGIWGNVYYLHADKNQLLVGGWFFLRDPEPVYGIARFDKELGTHDTNWAPELYAFVSSIIIEDEVLYAAMALDFFDEDDELNFPVVAKLSTSHQAIDENWGPDILGMTVAMLADEDALYLGGEYADLEENPISAVQKINKASGEAYTEWGAMVRGLVISMHLHEEWLYLGGVFSIDGYPSINNLARIRLADGTPDENWAPRTNNLVYSLLTHGEYVYAAGEFTSVGHKSIRFLGRIHRQSGEVDTQWNPDPDNPVLSIQRINQDIIAAGLFRSIGQKDQAHFARLDAETGQVIADWTIQLGWLIDDPYSADYLIIQKLKVLEHELLLGGFFFYVNHQPKLGLARVDIPMPGIASQPLDQNICDGADAVFSIEASPGEGELMLQWQQYADGAWEDIPEATGPTLHIEEASTGQDGSMFRCMVSGLNGELISEAARLSVNLLYGFEEEKEICGGDVYTWHGQELSEAGTYTMEYQSIHGCDSIYVLHLQVFEVDNAISRDGRVLTANAQDATYQWVECHNDYAPIAGATQRTFSVESDGSFAVIVTQNQCSLMSECVDVSLVGITDPEAAESLWIYPNPTSGNLHLEFSIPMAKARIEIFDTAGKTVFTKTGFSGHRIELDLSGLPAGTFILRVTDRQNQFNRFFLKSE